MNRAQLVLARFDGAEYRLCRSLNRARPTWPGVLPLMRVASRLGDGPLWFVLLMQRYRYFSEPQPSARCW